MTPEPNQPRHQSRWISVARRIVPPDWRDAVGRDLSEESADRGLVWQALHLARVGLSLRAARAAKGATAAVRGGGHGLGTDIRLVFRLMRRERASTAAIVVTLALGIGATTATYAVFNTILFRPIPGLGSTDGLVTIASRTPGRNSTSFPDRPGRLLGILKDLPGLDGPGIGYKANEAVAAIGRAPAALADVMIVTTNYFRLLGVRARLGRLITDHEAVTGADVAVVSDRFWRATFGGDPSVIGAPIAIDGHQYTIVGVMDTYEEWAPSRVGTVAAWLPGGSGATMQTRAINFDTALVVGRLKAGAPIAAVEAEARARFAAAVPAADASRVELVFQPGIHPDGRDDVERAGLATFRFAIGAGMLLMLLSCANAANLLLARLMRRERAFALRTAIGASRMRVLRPVVLECAVLAAASTCLGLGLAALLTRGLAGAQLFQGAPVLADVPIDGRVVVFAAMTAAATLVAFTLLPALLGTRSDVHGLLQQGSRGSSTRSGLRHALVVVQLALALVLATTAGVLTRSMSYLRGLDLGMTPDGVVEFTVNPGSTAFGGEQLTPTFYRDVAHALARVEGVQSVGAASPGIFYEEQFTMLLRPVASTGDPAPTVHRNVSGPFFTTMGIPLLAGRTFTDAEYRADRSRPSNVAIVSETTAKELFGTPAEAIGQRVSMSEARSKRWDGRTAEIVGVVGDARSAANYMRSARPAIYEPDQRVLILSTLYVRSFLPPAQMEQRVVAAMRSFMPGLPLDSLQTVREELDALFPEERMVAMLLRAIAAFAVALGLFGVAAVMASSLTERARELGIRSALGASASRLVADVLGTALKLSVIGAGAGLAGFGLLSRALASHLHGVRALDGLTLAVTTAGLVLAALAAAWLPARRIAQIDPTLVLRAD